MFVRKMAGMLLASSMFVAVSVSPVYADATEKTAVNDLEKYVAEYDLDSVIWIRRITKRKIVRIH